MHITSCLHLAHEHVSQNNILYLAHKRNYNASGRICIWHLMSYSMSSWTKHSVHDESRCKWQGTTVTWKLICYNGSWTTWRLTIDHSKQLNSIKSTRKELEYHFIRIMKQVLLDYIARGFESLILTKVIECGYRPCYRVASTRDWCNVTR